VLLAALFYLLSSYLLCLSNAALALPRPNSSILLRAGTLKGSGLRLLEEDTQHVGLNIVCVGGDGRCAELRSDVK
jgi:hypothetical protein